MNDICSRHAVSLGVCAAFGPVHWPRGGFEVEGLMALFLVFIVGIINFAMHRAALESGHPALEELQWTAGSLKGRLGFAFEFLLLVTAMMLAASDKWGWLSLYFLYSAVNGGVVWLFLTRRI